MADEELRLKKLLEKTADFARRSIKAEMLDELEEYDWAEKMRNKCRMYIQNDGTKCISVDEIVDFLTEDALKTFPANVKEKCLDRMVEILDSLALL